MNLQGRFFSYNNQSDPKAVYQEMKEAWHERVPRVIERRKERYSSVLLPLVEKDGQLEVLFEVRAASLHHQPGEVCFPGGAVEEGESFEAAAVRETKEELSLKPEQIEIIAQLDYLETSSGLTVHAYLGRLKEYDGSFSSDEVDRVFTVPLSWILTQEPEKYVTAVHTIPGEDFPYERIPGGREYPWRKGTYDVYFYQYGDEVIWGMTAKILYAFVKLCRGERL